MTTGKKRQKQKNLPKQGEIQIVDKKAILPFEGGRIALPANERIIEFSDSAIQVKLIVVSLD